MKYIHVYIPCTCTSIVACLHVHVHVYTFTCTCTCTCTVYIHAYIIHVCYSQSIDQAHQDDDWDEFGGFEGAVMESSSVNGATSNDSGHNKSVPDSNTDTTLASVRFFIMHVCTCTCTCMLNCMCIS